MFIELKNSGEQTNKVLNKFNKVLSNQGSNADVTITEMYPVYSAMSHNMGHHRRHATLRMTEDGSGPGDSSLGLDREIKSLLKPRTFKWQIEMQRKKEEERLHVIHNRIQEYGLEEVSKVHRDERYHVKKHQIHEDEQKKFKQKIGGAGPGARRGRGGVKMGGTLNLDEVRSTNSGAIIKNT